MNIQDEIAKTKQRLVELEEIAKMGQWIPDFNEKYYIPDPSLEDFYGFTHWRDDTTDNHLKRSGMVLRTKGEAVEVGKRMYYRQWYDSLSDDMNEWNCRNEHWVACYDHQNNKIAISSYAYGQFEETFFASAESCRKAIDTIGEDNFIKYILRIKDNEKNNN